MEWKTNRSGHPSREEKSLNLTLYTFISEMTWLVSHGWPLCMMILTHSWFSTAKRRQHEFFLVYLGFLKICLYVTGVLIFGLLLIFLATMFQQMCYGVIVIGNRHDNISSNAWWDFCISYSANTLGKGMNLIILPLAVGK